MLWIPILLPVLAVPGLLLLTRRTRDEKSLRSTLALGSTTTLGATALAAGIAIHQGWTGRLVWSGTLTLHLKLEPFSSVMAVLVPVVAAAVVLYAAFHEERPGLRRLVVLLTAFVGGMELLVCAADLLALIVGWELVGALSWALIAHHWRQADHPRQANVAFVVTRTGDLGLFVAAGLTFAHTGSFTYEALASLDTTVLSLAVAGIVVAAAAKSAQVPFAPWLFSAMAGPPSVSALLHSATMVAAGAFLLARLQPTLTMVSWFAPAVVALGLATALAGSLVALLQTHSKKLLAGSTSAHYGLMFVATGAGYPAVAILHLVAHAFFKAPKFLGHLQSPHRQLRAGGHRPGAVPARRGRRGGNLRPGSGGRAPLGRSLDQGGSVDRRRAPCPGRRGADRRRRGALGRLCGPVLVSGVRILRSPGVSRRTLLDRARSGGLPGSRDPRLVHPVDSSHRPVLGHRVGR